MNREWEYHQNNGSEGPFGYLDGWFVNWALENDRLAFSLELDKHDIETGELDRDDLGNEEGTERYVSEWLAREQSKEYSLPLSDIMATLAENE